MNIKRGEQYFELVEKPDTLRKGSMNSSTIDEAKKYLSRSGDMKQYNEKVRVYHDYGFQGRLVELVTGPYDAAKLSDVGILNDVLSSITIPEGLKVTIYEDESFGGSSKTFSSSVNCLKRIGFNDKTSSIIVKRQL